MATDGASPFQLGNPGWVQWTQGQPAQQIPIDEWNKLKYGSSYSSGQSSSSSSSSSGGGAPVVAPDNADLRGKLVDLIKTTTDAYNTLLQGGRDNDAFALRDAMERFARTGTQAGVSPWARTQAINDLRARMGAAATTLQGTVTANALAAQGNILGQIGNLDAATFRGMLDAQAANLNQAKFQEEKSQNSWARMQAQNALSAQLAQQRKPSVPSTRSESNTIQPVAAPRTVETNVTPTATPFVGDWRINPSTGKPVAYGTGTAGAMLGSAGTPVKTTNANAPVQRDAWGNIIR